MTSWNKLAQKLRVPVGTVLGILFLWFMHPSSRSLWIGAAIALPGSLLRVWAAGHIEKGKVLTQGGPYAYTRNPLYLGSFLMALGIILAGQGYWLLPAFAAFFAVVYFPVMKAEEQELLAGYGEKFVEYSRRVPLFIPAFRKTASASSSFLWSRVIRNREHRTIAGLLVAEAILILKNLL
ncbi:MAG: isoprenylcysteine carboxylmethyltransferase family protein [Acidobacteria bacterium]|nr:isoprenylcysteine carboxylmethyltransferase family protein [Acidobacteriota bacterium]